MNRFVGVIALVTLAFSSFAYNVKSQVVSPKSPSQTSTTASPKTQTTVEPSEQQAEVEELITESRQIDEIVQAKVDRAFAQSSSMIQVVMAVIAILISILTLIPVLLGVAAWFLRQSIINQIVSEIRKELTDNIIKMQQMSSEAQGILMELKYKTDLAKNEVDSIKYAISSQMQSMLAITHQEKEKVINAIHAINLSSNTNFNDVSVSTQSQLYDLTQQLERLRIANPKLFFTANDHYEEGRAFLANKDLENALKSFRQGLESEPEHIGICFSTGLTLWRLGQYNESLKFFEKVTQLQPNHTDAWIGMGITSFNLQRYEESLRCLGKAIGLRYDDATAWYYKACCCAMQKNTNEAIRYLKFSIQFDSSRRNEAKNDPCFDLIKDNDEFQALLR